MGIPFSPRQIALSTQSDLLAVKASWPYLSDALLALDKEEYEKYYIPVAVAVAATAGVECHFKPINEYGNPAYFTKMYWDDQPLAKRLGNQSAYDAVKYHGRGYIQLTGRNNYAKYGQLLNQPLVERPELALQPDVSALILVKYMQDHGCFTWARRGNWLKVRTLVNGGTNGLERFLQYVWRLLEAAYA